MASVSAAGVGFSEAGVGSSSSSLEATASGTGTVGSLVDRKLSELCNECTHINKLYEKKTKGQKLSKNEQVFFASRTTVNVLIGEYMKLRNLLPAAIKKDIEDLITVLYFGFIDDASDLLNEQDLDVISELCTLMTSRPVSTGVSHKIALQDCVEHAMLWLRNADQPIGLASITYSGLKKLRKILASSYFVMDLVGVDASQDSSVAASSQPLASAIIEDENNVQLISKQPRFNDRVLFDTWKKSNRACVYSMMDYGISQVSHNNRFILDTNQFERLDTWLARRGGNCWSATYEKWKVRRPNEEACRVIQGMITAVFTLHKENQFHGSLEMLRSYAVQFKKYYRGGEEREEVKVTLLYDTLEKSFTVPGNNEIREGMENDINGLRVAIFQQLLEGKEYEQYPVDLIDLYNSLWGIIPECEKEEIIDHPALWHWRRRLKYFHGIFLDDRHSCTADHPTLITKWNSVKMPDRRWRNKAISDPILSFFYNYNSGQKQGQGISNYSNNSYEQCRFVRNFCEHVSENELTPHYGSKFLTGVCLGQFIEHIISEKFPGFLLALYKVFHER